MDSIVLDELRFTITKVVGRPKVFSAQLNEVVLAIHITLQEL